MKRGVDPVHAEPENGVRRWSVRFDAAGLERHEIRMLQELIEGNTGFARLALCGESPGDGVERRIAETVRDALAADFPRVTFHVQRA